MSCRRYLKTPIALIVGLLVALESPAATSAEPVCSNSSPPSGAYTVTVCIVDVAADVTLTGEVPVTATVTVTGAKISISRVIFTMNSEYVLSDFQAPYTFILPSQRWVDGARNLQAKAAMGDGFTTPITTVPVSLSNGVLTPPTNPNTFTPRGTTPPEGQPLVVATDGDGASGKTRTAEIVRLVESWAPNIFLYLGDVYQNGSTAEFHNWYGSSTGHYFGRFRDITNPTPGNHEYASPGAAPYFDYWDNVPHYYSYDAGGWHFISLDSNSNFNQTAVGTPQYEWLVQDLGASTPPCTIAYWHHPRFSTYHGDTTRLSSIWSLLHTHDVDLVVSGHDHLYQRWHPLDGAGNSDPNGVTQMIVGTGGHSIYTPTRTDSRVAIGIDRYPDAYGAVRLELNRDGLAYAYVTPGGVTKDSGTLPCTSDPDMTAPSAPTLSATAETSQQVSFSWSSSADNIGVTGYEVYRDGNPIASLGTATSFVDATITPGATHGYEVRSRDAAGNLSEPSNAVSVLVPSRLFADGFETGNMALWTKQVSIAVEGAQGFGGGFGARAASTEQPAFANKDIATGINEAFWSFRFKIASKSKHAVHLSRFRTSTGYVLGGLFLNPWNRLVWRNNPANINTTGNTSVTVGEWHRAEVHVVVNGGSSLSEVWLDDKKLGELTRTESLGTTPIKRFQLAESNPQTGRSFDIIYDDVSLTQGPLTP